MYINQLIYNILYFYIIYLYYIILYTIKFYVILYRSRRYIYISHCIHVYISLVCSIQCYKQRVEQVLQLTGELDAFQQRKRECLLSICCQQQHKLRGRIWMMDRMWKNQSITGTTKMVLVRTLIFSVFLYGAEVMGSGVGDGCSAFRSRRPRFLQSKNRKLQTGSLSCIQTNTRVCVRHCGIV